MSWVRAPSATPSTVKKPCYLKDSGVFCFLSDVRADVRRFRESSPCATNKKAPRRGCRSFCWVGICPIRADSLGGHSVPTLRAALCNRAVPARLEATPGRNLCRNHASALPVQQQLKLCSLVGRLRHTLGTIQPRPLWPSPGAGGSRRCLALSAGAVVILPDVCPPLLPPFNTLNILRCAHRRWFL